MAELDLDKNLRLEAQGNITIGKFIKVEAGAVYNDGGEVTVNVLTDRKQDPKDGKQEPGTLPPELSTPQAMTYWQRLQEAGMVDEACRPLVSRTQLGVIVFHFSKAMGWDPPKWKIFEKLFGKQCLNKAYDTALNQQRNMDFIDSVFDIFAD